MSQCPVTEKLKIANVRPTQHRVWLGRLLWADGCDRHVTAESLFQQALKQGMKLSLATVYNTLHQFKDAGLLREVPVGASRSYFDTNLHPHAHVYCEETGHLCDVELDKAVLEKLIALPADRQIACVDVIVRLQ